jgi:hypothetical protein
MPYMAVNQINNYYFGTNQPLADTAEAIFKGILKDHELSMVQRCDILHVQVPAETYFNMCVCERERETERERQRNQITTTKKNFINGILNAGVYKKRQLCKRLLAYLKYASKFY